jgi:hypothetical protein
MGAKAPFPTSPLRGEVSCRLDLGEQRRPVSSAAPGGTLESHQPDFDLFFLTPISPHKA